MRFASGSASGWENVSGAVRAATRRERVAAAPGVMLPFVGAGVGEREGFRQKFLRLTMAEGLRRHPGLPREWEASRRLSEVWGFPSAGLSERPGSPGGVQGGGSEERGAEGPWRCGTGTRPARAEPPRVSPGQPSRARICGSELGRGALSGADQRPLVIHSPKPLQVAQNPRRSPPTRRTGLLVLPPRGFLCSTSGEPLSPRRLGVEGSAGQTTGAAGGEGSEAARGHRARSPGLPGTRLVTLWAVRRRNYPIKKAETAFLQQKFLLS